MEFRQSNWFITRFTPHVLPITNPRHSLLPCTVLLVCRTSNHLCFKQSFTVSIYVLRVLPTERLPANFPTMTSLVILSFFMLYMDEPSSILSSAHFITPKNSLICTYGTLSILLLHSKVLRLSIYKALILDLFFIFHIIVSLAYIKTDTIDDSSKTLANSSCKSLDLTRDLIAPCNPLPSHHLPTALCLNYT